METRRTETRPWGFMIRMDVTPRVTFPGHKVVRAARNHRRPNTLNVTLPGGGGFWLLRRSQRHPGATPSPAINRPDPRTGRNRPKGGALHNAGVCVDEELTRLVAPPILETGTPWVSRNVWNRRELCQPKDISSSPRGRPVSPLRLPRTALGNRCPSGFAHDCHRRETKRNETKRNETMIPVAPQVMVAET